MAISGSDGSIILTTKVDQTGLKKGIGSIKKFGTMASNAFIAVAAAAGAATVAITKMAVSAYADYEQLIGGVETLFKGSAGKVLEYANQAFQTAGVSANEYMQQVTSFSASLIRSTAGDTDKAADIANMALIDISDNVNKMGSSMESVTLAYQGFAKQQYMLLDNLKLGYGGTKTEMERLLKDAEALTGVKYDINNLADVYSAIHVIQEQLGITGTTMKEAETTITGSLGMVKSSWQNLLIAMSGGGDLDRAVNNFVYSLEKFVGNISPVIERTLVGLGQALQRSLPILMQMVTSALMQQAPNLVIAVYSMIIAMFKGAALGIKKLFSGESSTATEIIKGNIETGADAAGNMAENMNDAAKEIKKAGKEAKKSLASFDELNVLTDQTPSEPETIQIDMPQINQESGGLLGGLKDIRQEISTELAAIMAVASVYLVALGLMLIYLGQIPLGVGLIVAGASSLGATLATISSDGVSQEVKDTMSNALIIAGVIAIVLGVLLCIAQLWGYGIAFIALGATSVIAPIALNWNGIVDQLRGTFGVIMALIGTAALVIGIILACTGVGIPIAIALIVVGAAALVTPIVANWNSIIDKIGEVFNSILDWVVKYGMLVLGILLCFVTGSLPLGIALIYKWAKENYGNGIPLADAIVEKVKEAWIAIKSFWGKNIAPIFTLTYWRNLAKKCGNGLLTGFGNAINSIISLFEKMINYIVEALNKISFDVPKWVPNIGGKKFGFNIPKASFKKVSIPQLAQGAVIPPNREFLAVLGDQKRGTNIEAPLDTIKQAVAEVLAQVNVGGGYNGRIEVPVIINGREIARAVREAEDNMGTQTVFGGFANVY